jgi:sec-independent protein translocase protein TatA
LFGSLGAPELLIILAIVVVLFGATRIGDIGKGVGRGIREFRRELKDDKDEEKKETTVSSTTSTPTSNSTTTTTTEDKRPIQH